MLNLTPREAQSDSFKMDQENEESEQRIASIFHDVAKSQELESFIDYSRRCTKDITTDQKTHEAIFEFLHTQLQIAVEKHRRRIENEIICGKSRCEPEFKNFELYFHSTFKLQ